MVLNQRQHKEEKYRKFHYLRSGVDGAEDDTLNSFDWAIIISMLVQFCRCAYVVPNDEIKGGLNNKTWDEWRAPPRPGTKEFDHAVFGFVDGEAKRWSWREMVEYALAKVKEAEPVMAAKEEEEDFHLSEVTCLLFL